MEMKALTWSFNIFKKRRSTETNHASNGSQSDGKFSNSSSGSSFASSLEIKTEIGQKDFQIVRKLGHGGFGRVFLAKYKGTAPENLVALKIIVKKEIPDSKTDREHVQAEHFCLTNLGHPFLVKLYCAYQTPTKLYYAMEFLQGGELFSWMEKFGKFKKVSDFMFKVYFYCNLFQSF